MVELIQTIFTQFSDNTRPLVFIRPKPISEPEIYQGDFDLLLHPNDVEYFFTIVHQACADTRHSFAIKRHRLDKLELTLFSHSGEQSVLMDIWTELDIKASNIKKGSAISVDSLLEKGLITFDEQGQASFTADFAATFYLSHLKSKKKSLDAEEVKQRLAYYQQLNGLETQTLEWINNPSPEVMEQANQKLQAMGLINYSLAHRLKKSHFRFKQDIRKQRKFIAIVGPDGVGKTTVIDNIATSVQGKYYRFKKLFRKSITYSILRTLNKKSLNKAIGFKLAKNQYDDLQSSKLFNIALVNGYLRGLTLGLGKLKLIDRYYPDLLVTGTRFLDKEVVQHPDAKNRIRWCPTPRAYIQLDAPASVILARKQELSEHAVDHLRHDYFELGYKLDAPLFVYINNSHSLHETETLLKNMRF
ncbi:hypothetical protein [Vibrio ziniensis]|uniref:Thymidylate kinase-like domain-containing protein n=1 Tax=Vibrio ziniensis TaxID=2711221 RepID=A0A6G7CLT6_9VIBR|nr:hypothetical protein [Vibrio ziniensis]QIH43008.1 hypothetical protein G5S32_14105 [Vibrio ziniensis]